MTNITATKSEGNEVIKGLFGERTKKERLLCVAIAAIYALWGFLACAKELPYTSLALGIPFSDALLCAAGTYTPFIFLGNVLGTVYYGQASIPRFLMLATAFVLRIITSGKTSKTDGAFSEPIPTKLAVSSIAAMVSSAMFLGVTGITAESAKTTLATLVTLPALTLIFSVYFKKPTESKTARYLYELSMLTLFSFSVYCTSDITYAFCSIGTLLAVFFTLCVAKYGGFARGAICGFLLGYIASPSYFLAFTVLGVSASLIFSFGVLSAGGIATLLSCVTAVLVGGANSLLSFVPETVISAAITTPILKFGFLPKDFPYPFASTDKSDVSDRTSALLAHLSSWRSVRRISDGLNALSQNVQLIADTSGEYAEAEERIVKRICAEVCDSCPLSPICHESEKNRTNASFKELISGYASNDTNRVPPHLSGRCVKLGEIVATVRSEVTSLPRKQESDPLLLSYSAVSSMLSAVAEKAEKELVFDKDAESSVSKALYSVGVPFSRVSVVGNTRKTVCIYGAAKGKLKKATPELLKALKRIFRVPYSAPTFDASDEASATFLPAKTLSAEIALSSSCKDGEVTNGDTAISFNDSDGNVYALISDGMGSGAAAAKSSSLTAELIKSLAECSIDGKSAAKLTGEALSKLCDECFATVDLLKLDLVSGSATVTKSHAAASYVLRNGSVYCCNAESMPLGINRDAFATETEFTLTDGDTVIMVSDGIASGPQDTVRITDMLGLYGDTEPKALADAILEKAIGLKGRCDDMSAMVIKVKKAS